MRCLKLIFIFMLVTFIAVNAQGKTKTSTAKKTVTEEVTPPPQDGVFIHLSSGTANPQKVLMALNMALKMTGDHDVYLFLDGDAVNVVLNNAKSLELPKFEASKIMIDKIVKQGVKIAVCSVCLEAANKTQFDLMKGITLADKNEFFDFTKGRIVSLSY